MSGGKAVRAGEAFVEVTASNTMLGRVLSDSRRKLQSFGSSLSSIGKGALGAGAGILAPLTAAAGALPDLSKMANTADAFGLTAEKASGLFGIMKASGFDMRDATEGLVTLGQRVTDALSGSGEEAQKLFQGLGVSAKEFQGLDPAEQFYKLHSALLAVKDPATRVQLLLKSVGEDTGKNLINTLSMSTDKLREMSKMYEISGEDLNQARQATLSYTMATAKIERAWQQVSVAVAPIVKTLADYISSMIVPLVAIIRANAGLIQTAAMVGGALVVAGAAFIAFGVATSALGTALGGVALVLGLVKAAILAVLSPVGLVTAGIAGLGYLFLTQTEARKKFSGEVGGYFDTLAGTAKTSFGAIKNAMGAGRLDLAWKVATTAIGLEFARLVNSMTGKWTDFKGQFSSGWDGVQLGISNGMVDILKGVEDHFRSLLKIIVSGLESFKGLIGEKAFNALPGANMVLGGLKAAIQSQPLIDAKGIKDVMADDDKANKAAREKARETEIKAAEADLARAQLEFNNAIKDANDAKSPEKKPGEQPKPPPKPDALGIGGSTGAFSGNFKQLLGGHSIQKEQLDSLKAINDTLNEKLTTAAIL